MSLAISLFALAVALWQGVDRVRSYGGWRAMRDTGAVWFAALAVACSTFFILASVLPRHTHSRTMVVLIGLASLAGMGAGIVGLHVRLMRGQHERFIRLYNGLRADGHRHVPEDRIGSLEPAIDLIERDRERVDRALAAIPLQRSGAANATPVL